MGRDIKDDHHTVNSLVIQDPLSGTSSALAGSALLQPRDLTEGRWQYHDDADRHGPLQ